MDYAIATYRSRNVTMQVYNYLIKNNITAQIVSTPRSANVGCGLSVKFPVSALSGVSQTLARGETFVGFFLVKVTNSGTVTTRL